MIDLIFFARKILEQTRPSAVTHKTTWGFNHCAGCFEAEPAERVEELSLNNDALQATHPPQGNSRGWQGRIVRLVCERQVHDRKAATSSKYTKCFFRKAIMLPSPVNVDLSDLLAACMTNTEEERVKVGGGRKFEHVVQVEQVISLKVNLLATS